MKKKPKYQYLYRSKEFYSWVEQRADSLEKVIQEKERALQEYPDGLPEGTIRANYCGTSHTAEQYFLRTEENWKNGLYLKKNPQNTKLVKLLIQKEYDEKILKAAKKEFNRLNKARKDVSKDALLAVFESMGKIKQKWIDPVILTDEAYVEAWKSTKEPSGDYMTENQKFVTKQKEHVRSKSEFIIANALYDAGVPYCYESPLKDRGRIWVRPDFTVLNVRTKKEFYWEHFGMMGDSEYSERAVVKINNYENHGMFSGKEMIYTFESMETPLNIENVEQLIQKVLT